MTGDPPYTVSDGDPTKPYVVSDDSPGDPGLSARNILRSFMQGATLNTGDSKYLPASVRLDAGKEAAFKQQHGIADFLLKLGGGAVAPILATLAAPEALAGLGGAALLGAGAGAVSGAAEGNDVAPMDRLENAGQGGALGMAAGSAGYGLSKAAGGAVSAVLDRLHPERAVARGAKGLVDAADMARLNDLNAQAPGTASPATTVVPAKVPGAKSAPRFLPMLRGIGANPQAAATAEQAALSQNAAIETTKRALGAHMDALNSRMPVTPRLRATMDAVRTALGNKTPGLPDADFRLVSEATPDAEIQTAQSPHPDLRQAISDFWTRQGIAVGRREGTVAQQMAKTALDRHITENVVSPSLTGEPTVVPGEPAQYEPETVDVQVLRDALGRLRYMARNAAKRGTEANGPTTYEIKGARNALQDALYQHEPKLADLDAQYGTQMNQQRSLNQVLNTIRLSRANHGAATAADADVGSVGGSIMKAKLGVLKTLLNSATGKPTNSVMSPKAAAAMGKYILTPGDATGLEQLLRFARPASPRIQATANAASASVIPALRGLLTPASDDEQQ